MNYIFKNENPTDYNPDIDAEHLISVISNYICDDLDASEQSYVLEKCLQCGFTEYDMVQLGLEYLLEDIESDGVVM